MGVEEQETRRLALIAANRAIGWATGAIFGWSIGLGAVLGHFGTGDDAFILFGVGAVAGFLFGLSGYNQTKMNVEDLRRRHEYMDRT